MKLTLRNFRRFAQATFDLSESTLFIGPNGVGKTTVLEALHYLSVGRSHRTMHDRELIGWDGPAAHATVTLTPDLSVERSVAEQGTLLQKKARHNGVNVPLLHSLGLFHVVLFAPELVELLTGAPRLRRRYLDILLASTDVRYASLLAEYQQALKQRNQLLASRRADDPSLGPWDAILADRGALLIRQRSSVVQFLAELVPGHYQAIAGSARIRTPHLSYLTTVPDLDHYQDLLAARRETDRRFMTTSTGPHRDDLVMTIDGRPIAASTSRGEQRTLLLALKRAELQFFDAAPSESPPILLLDDMFSELDEARSEALTDILKDRRCLITTTDATTIPSSIRSHVTISPLGVEAVV